MSYAPSSALPELVRRLDEAVGRIPGNGCCMTVKEALEDIVGSDEEFIDEHFLQPSPDSYARRLLHKDPAGRYSVLVMVWGPGQGTAVHDHDDMWCVECVYKGRIKVVSYRHDGEKDGLHEFHPVKTVYAGHGEAGALIPPFDHHTIENEEAQPAVTIHIYGGEMTKCHVFVPVGNDLYRKEDRQLRYTD